MGSKYEVTIWTKREYLGETGYTTVQVWQGQSLIKALWNLWKAKREVAYAALHVRATVKK